MVARIDRLARFLSHLLEVFETLRVRGVHFRSRADPIDTAGPSGVLMMRMLGAAAEFERSFIRERTKAGLVAAKARFASAGLSAAVNLFDRDDDPWWVEGDRAVYDD